MSYTCTIIHDVLCYKNVMYYTFVLYMCILFVYHYLFSHICTHILFLNRPEHGTEYVVNTDYSILYHHFQSFIIISKWRSYILSTNISQLDSTIYDTFFITNMYYLLYYCVFKHLFINYGNYLFKFIRLNNICIPMNFMM